MSEYHPSITKAPAFEEKEASKQPSTPCLAPPHPRTPISVKQSKEYMATGVMTEMAGEGPRRRWTKSKLWLYYISTPCGERSVVPNCNAKHIWAKSLSVAVLLAGENRPLN